MTREKEFKKVLKTILNTLKHGVSPEDSVTLAKEMAGWAINYYREFGKVPDCI